MSMTADNRGPASLAQFAYTRTGLLVRPGDILSSGDGEEWTFEGVARPAGGNSTGRVAMAQVCPESYPTASGRECVHIWHRGGIERREFFPSVFDLYLGDVNGEEA